MSSEMTLSQSIILFVPLLIVLQILILATAGQKLGEKKVSRISSWTFGLIFLISVFVLCRVKVLGPFLVDLSFGMATARGRLFHLIFSFDRLAAVMMVLISGICSLILLFSGRFMTQERGYVLYHLLLTSTAGTLLCMVSSGNLLMLFLFWQLLSWFLSLLAFHYAHPPTVRGSFRTFTMLRLGDVAFLSGIILAFTLYGTLDLQELFIRARDSRIMLSLWPAGWVEIPAVTAITLLIFVGAMSKSAQFPLHGWLPDSLFAPTPVHAILHAGIINAGGFLLNRLAPLYGLSSATLHLVFLVGALTAFLGAGMMLAQNDIKKTLGYSTIGQMGYMIMECGLGAFALAVFHLIAHGLFKATIFLNCGNVIRLARQEPRFPPKKEAVEITHFSYLVWVTGFLTTLIIPLVILLAAHGALSLPFRNSQGIVIFLFFSWVTSSQAILTLYRLQAVASRKVAAVMFLTLLLVVSTYLVAAESFTYFLYPDPGEVESYFRAAALPGWLFDILVGSMSLFVILGWSLLYVRSHGKSLLMPGWSNWLHVRLYLLFLNRLYLDSVAFRGSRLFRHLAGRLDGKRALPLIAGLLVLALILSVPFSPAGMSFPEVLYYLAIPLLLPLFPFHGIYLLAMTKARGYARVALSSFLPAAGYYLLALEAPHAVPPELLTWIRTLSAVGAVYGTLRALVEVRVPVLLAYAGISFYSIFWWSMSVNGMDAGHGILYVISVILMTSGMAYAWGRVEARYGEMSLNRLGGLARPMPRLAILFSLLVMAAVGLPPFGLFSGYAAMLLQPSLSLPPDMAMILFCWLGASWYLFRMMQQLLFGPQRPDLQYDDLRPAESASLAAVIILLLICGLIPYGFPGTAWMESRHVAPVEIIGWIK